MIQEMTRTTTTFHVDLEATTADELDDDELDQLLETLAPAGAAIAGTGHSLNVSLSVDGPEVLTGCADAARTAVDQVASAIALARVDRVTVSTTEVQDRDLAVPLAVPDLVSTTGVASLLGLSRQRVHTLLRTDPTFPPSVAGDSGSGPLFLTSAVRAWDQLRPSRGRQSTQDREARAQRATRLIEDQIGRRQAHPRRRDPVSYQVDLRGLPGPVRDRVTTRVRALQPVAAGLGVAVTLVPDQ